MYNINELKKGQAMKKLNIIVVLLLSLAVTIQSYSQYKSQRPEQTSVAQSLVRNTPNIGGLLNWFNPENFRMNHNFSMQYMSGGGMGLSLASYTNSMFYQVSDPLNVRLDVSLMGSPFGSYGMNFNKLFISRAEINYQPWQNFHLQLQYRQLPISNYGYYMPYHWYTAPTNLGDE
ncbi:MAG: hypothetical protein KKG06_05230 [Bacteroidetes bacterium]|jgi:hypothetical protein|nr:hypothetical protein [Bacteroidota bacterium]MBU1422571.1 hypothetical protein [Bacteroidota bacterium]